MKSQQQDKKDRKARFVALFDSLDGTKAAKVAQVAKAAGVQPQTVRRWCMASDVSDRAPHWVALEAISGMEKS